MNAFKGRLGYYATTYETYLKFKQWKKWYWEAVKVEAAKRRWLRKQPENRVGKEPVVCPHLYNKKTMPGTTYGRPNIHEYLMYEFIDIYNKIRMPAQSPETIPIIADSDMEDFEKRYSAAKEWFSQSC